MIRTHILRIFSNKILAACSFFILSVYMPNILAQSTRDASVELWANVQTEPPSITLNWIANGTATRHFIYRKSKEATSWGAVIGNVPGDAVSFTDTTVTVGTPYEYRVFRQAPNYEGHGYIYSGIDIGVMPHRGAVILVVDNTFEFSLEPEIDRFITDLEGDGWVVFPLYVPRDTTVVAVKNMIKEVNAQLTSTHRALCLLGHVPVPYSGLIVPDGHPDHQGAWPADGYYGELNGQWTDNVINSTVANAERNRNVPGDGKFDQSTYPNGLELQVGRIDFANMPAFAQSEEELLRQYLNKNHAYRHGHVKVASRGLVDDNFGYFNGEAFAASGWKNLGPLVGAQNVVAGDYFPDMADSSYLWSYGCGGGWYEGAGGVGSTGDFAGSNLKTVFTMLFGSYFGDWDVPNSFLRAPLAQGLTLTNAWSGRPHWMFHHMGMNDHIGQSARLSQGNNSTYFFNRSQTSVHMALMGDPTLRMKYVAPVSNVQAVKEGYDVRLTWSPSPDSVIGYFIFNRTPGDLGFGLVNPTATADTSYVIDCYGEDGEHDFMVRAITLASSPSGTFYALSQGIQVSLENTDYPRVEPGADYAINGTQVFFTNTSVNALQYEWDFGDGNSSTETNPVHVYADGEYTVQLLARNECDIDSFTFDLSLSTSTGDAEKDAHIIIAPNPSDEVMYIHGLKEDEIVRSLTMYAPDGRAIVIQQNPAAANSIHVQHLNAGAYVLEIKLDQRKVYKRLIIK